MASNVLVSFPTAEKRDRFLSMLVQVSDAMLASDKQDGYEERKETADVIKEALRTVRLNPSIRPDHERNCALFVSGQKMIEGNLRDLNSRFEQEIASHSASVQIRELVDGEWIVIRRRAIQK